MYSPLPGLVYFASLLAGLLSVLGKLIANPSALKSSESLRAGDTKVRPDEPPKLPPKVPLVGHLLRVVFEGTEYLRVLQYVWLPHDRDLVTDLLVVLSGFQSSPCLSLENLSMLWLRPAWFMRFKRTTRTSLSMQSLLT